MKSVGKILTFVLLLSLLVSCAPAAATPEPPANEPAATDVPAPVEPALSAAEQWAKDNEVGPYQPETLDWAAIEAAAKEEGVVVVYANTSRIEDEIELFQTKYPDIKLEGYDADNIATKMSEEQKAGNIVGDVWFNSDGSILFGEFVPKQWLWAFVPDKASMPVVTEEQPFAVARYGVRALGYNTELNPDGCPISNWWELVEPEMSGKVFIEDPLADVSTLGILADFPRHGDEFAATYQELYGKEWTTDADYTADLENAAWLWIKKYAINKPGLVSGGDDAAQGFAAVGMTADNGVGFTSYSKYRDTLKGDLAFDVCKDAKPVMGMMTSTYLAIATNAPHPNAAKLFIQFVLSEEGRVPWGVIGNYSAVTGQAAAEGAIPWAELNVWTQDDAFVYANISKMRDFWTLSLLD